jgi:predicted ATP-grasp superfamily ATP-dependent carboligase
MGANYNAYYWEGEPLCEFTAHKIRNAPPWLGSPSVLISEKIPEIVDMGRNLLSSVGFSGYACTEFKRDPRDGTYKLMEVNVRHNLSSLLSVRCGLNFPWMEYQHLVEGIKPQPQDFKTGVYWIDMFRDVGARVFNKEKPTYTLSQMLSPYLHKHVFAFFDWKDIKPFLLRSKNFVRGTLSYFTSNKSNTNQ